MALPAVFLGAREFSTSVFNPIELQILAVVLRARSSAFSLGNTRYLESQGTYHWHPVDPGPTTQTIHGTGLRTYIRVVDLGSM